MTDEELRLHDLVVHAVGRSSGRKLVGVRHHRQPLVAAHAKVDFDGVPGDRVAHRAEPLRDLVGVGEGLEYELAGSVEDPGDD